MRLDCGGMEFEKLADLLELGRKAAVISWQFIREIQSAHYSSKRSHWNVNCMTMAISDIFG